MPHRPLHLFLQEKATIKALKQIINAATRDGSGETHVAVSAWEYSILDVDEDLVDLVEGEKDDDRHSIEWPECMVLSY